jgi:signal peptidase II
MHSPHRETRRPQANRSVEPAPRAAASGDQSTKPRRAVYSFKAVALFIAFTLSVFAADQALKYLAFDTTFIASQPIEINTDAPEQTFIPPNAQVTVVDHVLALRLMINEGAVFGLGDGFQWLFIVVSIVAAVVLIRLFWVSPANAYVTHLALALILAGDLGNLYDRLMYNSVRDMLAMLPGVPLPFGIAWPNGMREVWPWIFNIADAALMVGVGLVLVVTWRNERHQSAAESRPS